MWVFITGFVNDALKNIDYSLNLIFKGDDWSRSPSKWKRFASGPLKLLGRLLLVLGFALYYAPFAALAAFALYVAYQVIFS